MTDLLFPLDEVQKLARHAIAAPEHSPVFTEHEAGITNPTPGLHWVKDSGTYLMSNGIPGRTDLIVYGSTREGLLLKQPEHYAEDAEAWEDIWETTRDICGGDDFVEKFDLCAEDKLAELIDEAIATGFTHMVLHVSASNVGVSFVQRKATAKC